MVVPADWKEARLGEVVTRIYGGGTPSRFNRNYWGNEIPWATVKDIATFDGLGTQEMITRQGLEASASQLVPAGTLIVCTRMAPGSALIFQTEVAINQDMKALICSKETSPGFLRLVLNFKKKELVGISSGSTVAGLGIADLTSLRISLPPLKEQEVIAEALSDADVAIESLDALIAKKRDVKQAATQQLLTGRTRLPGFTADWKEVRLGDLGLFSKGAGIKKDDVVSVGVPCVRYGQLYTEHHSVIRSIRSFVSAKVASTSRPLVAGEVLFAGSGETKAEIGKCVAYVDEIGAVAGGDLVILTPKHCSSIFLGYALNSPDVVRQKIARAQGDAVVHISAASLATVIVGLPPLKEQEAIAEALTVIDDELEALTEQVSKLQMVKEGMMQDLLTGKVRLV